MSFVEQVERGSKLTHRHSPGCSPAGAGNDHGNGSCGRVVRSLQVNLIRTDKTKIRRLTVDFDAGPTEGKREITLPDSIADREVASVNCYPFARLNRSDRAVNRNDERNSWHPLRLSGVTERCFPRILPGHR